VNAHHVFLASMVAACAVGALVDLRTGNIPNWLTLGLIAIAPLSHAAVAWSARHSWTAALMALAASLGGAVVSAMLPLFLYRVGGLGLGDVKLFAAIGATCGAFVGLYAQTYAYVLAMVYALALVAYRGKLAATLSNVRGLVTSRAAKVDGGPSAPRTSFTEVRFGPAIAAGMCVAAWAQWRLP
jgi:prepilin peptidase CpaA